ncbi:MAG: aspartyl/asparaginyl beta-hydroxylase domain-containing protein [Flavobacterium circumlabens]|uniref:aspartyl/asparaginyl beta-hydroxylase domain-containing protein n=1 Tax=Flavobacterium circumlabens TaxID=2133765 RepID=UPI003262DD56
MDTLIRFIKFPISFDVDKLKSDLSGILNKSWTAHYNKNDYTGKWTSVALMSTDGKSNNIFALSNTGDEMMNTEILASCPYFKEILERFHFEKTAVRLLQLAAGAEIKPHSDHCLGYEDGSFRLHIPIITNPDVEFILDGKRLMMKEGECWYIDANFTHSVANRGNQDRIHLVIDGIRNDWTDALFYKEAPENQFVKPEVTMSEEQKLLVIAELKRMNTSAANELIKNLK